MEELWEEDGESKSVIKEYSTHVLQIIFPVWCTIRIDSVSDYGATLENEA